MRGAGALRDRVAFDAPVMTPDGYGGKTRSWSEGDPVWAEIRHERGSENVEAGGLTGRATFKVRVRSSTATRAITTDHRMRDLARGLSFNIRSVDAITDRAWVFIGIEGGVAV